MLKLNIFPQVLVCLAKKTELKKPSSFPSAFELTLQN